MKVVCDKCRIKIAFGSVDFAWVLKHLPHNFTGLRIVRNDNPCPNLARDYKEVSNG